MILAGLSSDNSPPPLLLPCFVPSPFLLPSNRLQRTQSRREQHRAILSAGCEDYDVVVRSNQLNY